jgi:hypothetical protein
LNAVLRTGDASHAKAAKGSEPELGKIEKMLISLLLAFMYREYLFLLSKTDPELDKVTREVSFDFDEEKEG